MPLDRLVLLIVCVIAAAGVTVWLGSFALAALQVPGLGWMVAIPVVLAFYIGWRVIAERLGNKEDDHYDRIEK